MWPNGLLVVQIGQHGRALRSRHEQVLKLSERMRPNGGPLILDEIPGRELLLMQVHIEVIQPEVGHHGFELAIAVDIPQKAFGQQFTGN